MASNEVEIMKAEMRGMLKGARLLAQYYLVDRMPDKATNDHQRQLQAKHGTPREFALAVVGAIGEISVSQAETAIDRYYRQWNDT